MDLGLKGRTALVGGASRGLGFACAMAFAQEGANVAVCSRNRAAIEAAAERIASATGVRTLPIPCDQRRPGDLEQMVETIERELGPIEILVNNTGGPPPGLFQDHDDEAWTSAFDGLLMSVVRLCRLVLPSMKARGWGRIINNTSFTVKEPAERLILSNALRSSVLALGKTLARETAADGITVNTVCPGPFDTDRLRALFREQADATGRSVEAVRSDWEARVPIGRLPLPEELAHLVAFLASDRAAAITGACIPVDGGLLHGLY